MATRMLSHDDIEIGGGTQARSEINYFVVNEYAEHYRNGVKFPPLVVYDDGAKKWLSRGFHRFHASKDAGVEKVECEIRKGSKRDAVWDAIADNQTHGLRRTNADKRRAVELALKDGKWEEMNDDALGEHIGVSHEFVRRVRNELSTVESSEATKRIGKDGKKYPATYKKPVKSGPPTRADRIMDEIEATRDEIDEHDHQHGPSADTKDQARAALAELDACLQELGIDCDKEIAAIRIKLMKH